MGNLLVRSFLIFLPNCSDNSPSCGGRARVKLVSPSLGTTTQLKCGKFFKWLRSLLIYNIDM